MTNLRQVTWLTTIINAFEYSNSRYQLNPSTSIVNPQTDKFPEIILNYSFTQLIKTPTQKLPITTNSIVTEKWKKKNTYSGETGIELLPHGIELGINQAQRNENPRKEVELEEGGGELEAENRKWRSGRQNQRKRACVRAWRSLRSEGGSGCLRNQRGSITIDSAEYSSVRVWRRKY